MARAPVYGSGRWPAWIDRVSKPNWRGPVGMLPFGPWWPLVDWPAPAWPLGPCCSGMLSLPPARYERLYLERRAALILARSRVSPDRGRSRSAMGWREGRSIEKDQRVGGRQCVDGTLGKV